MNPYIDQLKTELAEYDTQCGAEGEMSVLNLLWYRYSARNTVDDGQVREADTALRPVFDELSVKSSDILYDLIAKLVTAYQRAAFLEGIQVGFCLNSELDDK